MDRSDTETCRTRPSTMAFGEQMRASLSLTPAQ
jgi:hypothetical protein